MNIKEFNDYINLLLTTEGFSSITWGQREEVYVSENDFSSHTDFQTQESLQSMLDFLHYKLISLGFDSSVEMFSQLSKDQRTWRLCYTADNAFCKAIADFKPQENDIKNAIENDSNNRQSNVLQKPMESQDPAAVMNCQTYLHPASASRRILKTQFTLKDIMPENKENNVIFILDRSGSMGEDNKWQLLLGITQRCIENLPEKSTVSIISFNDTASLEITNAPKNQPLPQALKGRIPSGKTDLLKPFTLLTESKLIDEKKKNVVIFVTDGENTEKISHLDAFCYKIYSQLNHNTALIPVGIGPQYDKKLMDTLTRFAEMPTTVHIADSAGFQPALQAIKMMCGPLTPSITLTLSQQGKVLQQIRKGRLAFGETFSDTTEIGDKILRDGFQVTLSLADKMKSTKAIATTSCAMFDVPLLLDWARGKIAQHINGKNNSFAKSGIIVLYNTVIKYCQKFTLSAQDLKLLGEFDTLVRQTIKGLEGNENAKREASYFSNSTMHHYIKRGELASSQTAALPPEPSLFATASNFLTQFYPLPLSAAFTVGSSPSNHSGNNNNNNNNNKRNNNNNSNSNDGNNKRAKPSYAGY